MQGEDDRLFSCRASKSPKPLWNYFRPHHWCFPLISFKQIFFSGECSYRFWIHFLRAGKSRPLWKTSQNRSTHSQLVACSLGRPMYASCQESHSQCTCEEELLFSHLNVEVTPGETTNLARWRGQDSPVSFTGLQTPSAFCLFQRTSPSCESFASDRRYHQWEGGKIPGGISHFTPSPSLDDSDQDQGGPNMSGEGGQIPLWNLGLSLIPFPIPQSSRVKEASLSPPQHCRHLFCCYAGHQSLILA